MDDKSNVKACFFFLILFLYNEKGSNHRNNSLTLKCAVLIQYEFSALRFLPVKCEKIVKLFFICYFIYCRYFYFFFLRKILKALQHSTRKHLDLGPRGRTRARDDSIGHPFF